MYAAKEAFAKREDSNPTCTGFKPVTLHPKTLLQRLQVIMKPEDYWKIAMIS